jgi:hypothetical protein
MQVVNTKSETSRMLHPQVHQTFAQQAHAITSSSLQQQDKEGWQNKNALLFISRQMATKRFATLFRFWIPCHPFKQPTLCF